MRLALFALLLAPLAAGGGHQQHSETAPSYQRLTHDYAVPDVQMVEADGTVVAAADALSHEGPLALQFIFTTCPGVCPVLSAIFTAIQRELAGVRLVSITIDPEHDTAARLQDYARRHRVGESWQLYTGRATDIDALRRAFGVYQANKMQHEPVTFLRAPDISGWVRLDGLINVEQLLAELRRLQ